MGKIPKTRKPLNKKMLRCIEIMAHEPHRTNQDIANEININNGTISQWLKRDDFQQALKEENQRKFKSLASRAIKRLEQLMDSENEKVSLDASKEILNKSGYQEPTKIEQDIKNEIVIEITNDNLGIDEEE